MPLAWRQWQCLNLCQVSRSCSHSAISVRRLLITMTRAWLWLQGNRTCFREHCLRSILLSVASGMTFLPTCLRMISPDGAALMLARQASMTMVKTTADRRPAGQAMLAHILRCLFLLSILFSLDLWAQGGVLWRFSHFRERQLGTHTGRVVSFIAFSPAVTCVIFQADHEDTQTLHTKAFMKEIICTMRCLLRNIAFKAFTNCEMWNRYR